MIYACIPYTSKKYGDYKIPGGWDFPSNVKIVRCKDYGPITKLIGCLEWETDPDTMIITIDDDQEYNKDIVLENVTQAVKFPDYCLSSKTTDSNMKGVKCEFGTTMNSISPLNSIS